MSNQREILIPDIGGFESVEIIDILVKPDDKVKQEDPLITLESDKATMDIPSPAAGIIKEIKLKPGDNVTEGTVILLLEETEQTEQTEQLSTAADAGTPDAPATAQQSSEQPTAQDTEPPAATGQRPAPHTPTSSEIVGTSNSARAHASPSVRKFAHELGVDLGLVRGSGRKGRIIQDDVKAFTKAVLSSDRVFDKNAGFSLPEIPPIDFSKFGRTETLPISRLKRIGGQNLHRSWINVPHVTQFDEADITELEGFRKSKKQEAEKQGIKLTLLTFLIKAVVVVLNKYPTFNASLSPNGEELILKKYFHIGFAVNTDAGLMVPVIKDADQKGLFDIARELAELATKARDKKLGPADMQGGCFTISSLGHIGGTGFTPIVNTPEVAILGVSRSAMKPTYIDEQFVPRLILPYSLSYDHRVIDGVIAAEFAQYLSAVLTDIRQILL